ncbi:Porin [Flavobacterium longum]|uniref:outer membrane beta-barrel protein n=1 Tax=Flavobacterium longum TaxID=1299340 RepID=UPI0039E79159
MKQICLVLLFLATAAAAQTDTLKVPFVDRDLTWINGQNRQQHFPLTFKDGNGETVIAGVAYLDSYFNYDFNNPIDNTHTISSTIGRSNEFTVNLASIGIESNYQNIIGRLWLQYGQMAAIVQDADGTVLHGRNTSVNNLKYIREAAAGYHFNKWYGVNVEMGIFMSYIGLESYITQENWTYQRSLVCDFTPFYFSGARLQVFPTQHFKTELWLLNGWQSYNSWTRSVGVGNSNYYRPTNNLQLVANFYYGQDSRQPIKRFHHDHSVVYRYFADKGAQGLSQAAFSLNNHYGFQDGSGNSAKSQFMLGSSLANRLWFNKNKLAVTFRADFVKNPGLHLAFSPSPVTPNDFTDAIANDPKQDLVIGQGTVTFDIMPNDYVTFRLECRYRKSNVPYFAGNGGTTSPDGWADTSSENWRPDLVKDETGITVAVNFRL